MTTPRPQWKPRALETARRKPVVVRQAQVEQAERVMQLQRDPGKPSLVLKALAQQRKQPAPVAEEMRVWVDELVETQAPAPKPQHGGKRPGAGRKAIAEGEESVIVPVRMSPAQRAKLKALGGAPWIRARIDRAKEPG